MLEPSKGKTKISGKYRVRQPIENFKIRVKIVQQKSLLAELFENADETRDSNFLEDEEYEFSWQEKVFGPYEAKYYREEKNCVTDKQKEYHQRLIDTPSIDGSRLYSYVQGDAYYPEVNPLSGKFRSCLSMRNERAAPPVKNRKPFAERYNKSVVDEKPSDRRIRENHYLYTEHENMYIVVDLSPKDETASQSTDSEALLCTISYDPLHKTLKVNPDFTGDECYSIDGIGMSYDFWIEHVSIKPTARELQRRREIAKREMQRLRNLKEAQLFHELHAPQPQALRVFLNLDITAARDFGYDDALFVSYFVDLPRNWRAAGETSRLAGRTQRCRARNGQANFSYCAEILLDLDLTAFTSGDTNGDTGLASWPNLLISVASLDSWTRYRIEGYGSLPLPTSAGSYEFNLKTWRPAAGFIDTLRRFFTGGTCELDDITYCAVPAMHEGPILDKTNLRVLPSGNVDLRINVVHQSQNYAKYRDMDPSSFERLNAGKLLSSVNDVLSQFKAARERMIQARAMCS